MNILRKVANGTAAFVVAFSSVLTMAAPAVVHAAAQTCTWTGTAGDNKFSTATNWTNCNSDVPQAGDVIKFDNASVPATPQSDTAPTVLMNDLNVAFGGLETNYSSTSGAGTVYISTLKFADGGYFEATAPSGTSHLYVTVGTVQNGQTSVTQAAVTADGSLDLRTDGLTYGTLSVMGNLIAGNNVYIGSSVTFAGTLTLENGSYWSVHPSQAAIEKTNPIIVGGGSGTTAPQIYVSDYQSYDSATDKWTTNDSVVTFSGSLTLNGDVDVTAGGDLKTTVKFTGAVTGTGKILRDKYSVGTLITPSGALTNPVITTTLDGDIVNSGNSYPTGSYASVVQNETSTLNGKRESITVFTGGTLKGTGTIVSGLYVADGGHVAPGNSPGCLTTGTLDLSGEYQFELGGATPCSEYDQIKVTSTEAASASNGNVKSTKLESTAVLTTSRYNNYVPKKGQVFIIIDNQGPDAVDGTFKDLPEGATFTQNGVVFKISYVGGTGNDVTLTVVSVPATPDTGVAFLTAHPLVTTAVLFMLGTAIAVMSRRAKWLEHKA